MSSEKPKFGIPNISRRTLLAGFAASGIVLPMRSSFAQTEDWDAVVEAARKEGEILFYSGSVGVPDYVAVIRDFERKYGIKVEIFEARHSEMQERLRIELLTGQPSADVIYTGASSMVAIKDAGNLAPIGNLPLFSKIEAPFEVEEFSAPLQVNTYGILINTNLVPEEEAPQSWLDILDPKWQGRILADDPRAVGGGNVTASVLLEAFGREFHERLAAQKPELSRSQRENQRRLARGEFAIYVPFTMTDILRLEGLPVRAINPTEGNPYVIFSIALIKDAPHPNAARLLVNHFFEEEASQRFYENGKRVTVPASQENLPENLKELVNVRLLDKMDTSKMQEYLEIFGEIYG